VNSPGSTGRRVGNADNENNRAEIKAGLRLQSGCEARPSGMSYMKYEYGAVVVVLILEKMGRY
jgi:hypothetical protein